MGRLGMILSRLCRSHHWKPSGKHTFTFFFSNGSTHSKITGSSLFAFERADTIAPGPLATYVLLWPLISASSLTPPSEMRWNGRSRAFARLAAIDVLPHPGGPTSNKIGPFVLMTLGFFWVGII